ncbi:MAG: phosphatase PAP2 family protein [Porticoccaceae bacterium]
MLGYIQHSDVLTFNWCMRRKRRALFTTVGRLISRTADGPYYFVVPLALSLANSTAAVTLFAVLAGAFAIERPLYAILKRSLKRNRPADALPGFESFIVPADKFSFPSGHTSGAFLVATATGWAFPILLAPLYCWAVLVGTSRVFLGVHFPSDIAAGALMGTSIGLLAISVLSAGLPI